MIDVCRQMLTTNAAAWGLPAGRNWNLLFHNNSQPTRSTINLLWFYRNEEYPRVVTKMLFQGDSVLAQEIQSLQTVYAIAPRYIPRPMYLGTVEQFAMLWMEGVPGRRIPPASRYPASVLAASVDMLISIQRAANKGLEQSAAERHTRMVAAPLHAVMQHANRAVRDGCLALVESASETWLQTLPVIPQHGDLFIDNVLRHREQYHIVDWDNFADIDLPCHDLITLLLSFLQGATCPERWDPDLKAQVPLLVERYTRDMQLPPSSLSLLLPLALANQLYLHCRTVERRLWGDASRPTVLRTSLAKRFGSDVAERFGNRGAEPDFPLIEFVTAIEGRGAAAVMYAALEHYFEHISYWQNVFLGR